MPRADHSSHDRRPTLSPDDAAAADDTAAPVQRPRAVIDFRPYPTAPTRTRRSPANSARRDTTRHRRSPAPSTVWFTPPTDHAPRPSPDRSSAARPAGAEHDDGDDVAGGWALPVLARVVTSFSETGATVLLLPWPDPAITPASTPPAGTTRDGAHPADLAAAAASVADLERHPRTTHLPALHGGNDTDHPGAPDTTAVGGADLLITVMPARHDTARHVDAVARLAAHSLRLGGVLAVLTHCDWERGVLTDPSGPMVTAGQSADLLYLQHIVAVHLPPDDPRLHPTPAATATGAQTDRAHRRLHSDVLVFAQPHDHTAGPGAGAAPLP